MNSKPNPLKEFVSGWYRWLIHHPTITLLILAVFCTLAAFQSQNFYYDASADSLVAENDPELLYYRKVSRHFAEGGFLFLTYTPDKADLINPNTLSKISGIADRIEAIEGINSVNTILDAPLLQSPPIALDELANGYRTLNSDDVDFDAALIELTTSPLFKNLLISEDGKTTAFHITLVENPELELLEQERSDLRIIDNPTDEELSRLDKVNTEYRKAYAERIMDIERILDEIRVIRKDISKDATSYLGGLPMIASDMMHYVQSDLRNFGATSIILMMLVLFFFFRKIRWVIIPIATTGVTILLTIGILGLVTQPITVISSNFISILLILSVSMVVHLICRYREVLEKNPELDNREIVFKTMSDKLAPCAYTTLTTITGFASLATSSIIPVMDFGWIMCVGLTISFFVAYSFFPTVLLLFPKEKLDPTRRDTKTPLIKHAYRLSSGNTNLVLVLTVCATILTAWGVSKLSLENRFIDYFDTDTEINEGLTFIDKNMGGTIPMDIILNFPPYVHESFEDEDGDDDFFEEEDDYPQRYWFTPDKIELIRNMQDYLDNRPEIGKTISLATLENIAQSFTGGRPLTSVEMVAVLSALPEDVRYKFIEPYAAPESGIMRISARVNETGPMFSRDKLISDIEEHAVNTLQLEPGQVRVTGMNVLFNGMLKELFSSQTSTLAFVIGATFMMFIILLRSFSFALIGLVPNVLAAFTVLAFMGFVGIPLDMMTITIAAIVIGIGVDDAIHYLHYFGTEYRHLKDADAAVRLSHREIGRALYFTSLTVMVGFSVLCASNFIPTVYFGILTALAMAFALMANLTVVPALLLKFFKK